MSQTKIICFVLSAVLAVGLLSSASAQTLSNIQIITGGGFELVGTSTNTFDITTTPGGGAINISARSAGAGIYIASSTNYVGVGTTNPTKQFHVVGNSTFDGLVYASVGEDANAFVVYNGPNDNNQIRVDGEANNVILSEGSGSVGIGISPSYTLDVFGSGNFSQPVIVGSPSAANHATTRAYVDSAVAVAQSAFWVNSGSSLYPSSTSWNVGIGTTAPATKLDVNGTETTNRISQGAAGSTYTELATRSWGGNNAIFFGAYATSSYINGDFLTVGNTLHKYASSSFGAADHRAKAIIADHLGIGLYISGISPGANQNVTWNQEFLATPTTIYIPTNNVGIGQSAPGSKLSVSGGATIGANYSTVAAPTNGLAVEGSVGFGTTTPAVKLHIQDGNIRINNTTATSTIEIRGTGNSVNSRLHLSEDGASGGTLMFDSTANTLNLMTGTSLEAYTPRLVIARDSGNIGIGTTTPSYGLDVVSNAAFSQPVIVGSPSATNHATTRAYVDAAVSAIGNFWTLSGSNLFATSTTYSVAIGTSTPYGKLHVAGIGYSDQNSSFDSAANPTTTNAGGLVLDGGYSNGLYRTRLVKIDRGGNLPLYIQDSYGTTAFNNVARFGSHSYSTNKFEVYGNTGISGSLGLGTSSTPGARVHLWGNGDEAIIVEADADNVGEDDNPSVLLRQDGNLVNGIFGIMGATAQYTDAVANSTFVESKDNGGGSSLQFVTGGTTIGGTNGAARVTINSSGNVGVGTSTPSNKLDIDGSAGNNLGIRQGSTNSLAQLLFYEGHSTNTGYITSRGSTAATPSLFQVGGAAGHALALHANATEYLRITTTGNVGIGTTTPSNTLHVDGRIRSKEQFIQGSFSGGWSTGSGLVLDNGDGTYGSIFAYNYGASSPENLILQRVGGNVGIATTTPAYNLHVVGTSAFSQPVIVGSPSATNHATTRAYVDAAVSAIGNNWTLSGSNLFASSTTYSVGIGNSSPAGKLDITNSFSQGGNSSLNFGARGITSVSGNGVVSSLYGGYFETSLNTGAAGGSPGTANNYGIYAKASSTNFAHNNTGTTNYYGGYFEATGSPDGTDTTKNYGIYVNAAGGDTNYSGIFMGGNVGIGTATPGQKLDVVGKVLANNGSGVGILLDASAIGSGYTTTLGADDTGSFIYNDSASRKISLGVNSSRSNLVVDTTGNIGIGTTTPVSKLAVNGASTLYAGGSAWADGLNLYSNDKTNRWNFLVDDGASDKLRIAYNSGSVEAITIDTAGRVGIKNGSPNSGYSLDVNGAVYTSSYITSNSSISANYQITMTHPSTDGGVFLGNNGNSSGNEVGLYDTSNGYSLAVMDYGDNSIYYGPYLVENFNNGFTYEQSNGLRISNSLYVGTKIGIGTTTPATGLHLYDGASGPIITMSGLTNTYRGVTVKNTTGVEQWFYGPNTSNNFVVRQSGSTDKFTINSTGVGIGTAAQGPFHVALPAWSNHDTDSEHAIFGDGSTNGGVRIGYNTSSRIGIINVLDPGAFWGNLILQSGGGKVGIGTTTPATALQVIGTITATKLNADEVDPPYTINGTKYATYMAGMTGLKEETSGVIKIKNNKAVLDLINAEEGSDLWLFAKTINLAGKTYISEAGKIYKAALNEALENITVLLTPSFDGRVWYEKKDGKIFINSSEKNGEISYRLTGQRFDAVKKNGNIRTGDDVEGLNLDKLLK